MKHIFLGILFSFLSVYAENPEVEDLPEEELISYLEYPENSSPSSSHLNVDTFHQNPTLSEQTEMKRQAYYYAGGLFPTVGMGLRMYRNIGYELDFAYFLIGAKGSVSVFQYIGKGQSGYIGIGAGLHASILRYDHTFSFFIPGYIGIEGKIFFGDIGCDLLINEDILWPLPNLRVGVRF
ncbi:MAG: hypothetical protein P0S96_07130 [Simkaniaceae bacterium]|nr:hypothetical protein [Candidatus Sacchlamyda saccharinae]